MGFGHLFGRKRAGPHFLDGRIGYAIGDIHGRADLLARMFERLEADARSAGAAAPIAIFLGDYVDRGPDSAEVIELLQLGRPEGFERRFLKGNHEQALLAFLHDPVAARAWLAHGGLETLASYGVRPLPPLSADDATLRRAAAALRESLPPAHASFLDRLERYAVIGDYAFVHAGVDPRVSLAEQTDAALFWSRDRFLGDGRRLEKVIVHGHTPQKAPYKDHRRIGVDTGAYVWGALTAARFEADSVSFITVTDR